MTGFMGLVVMIFTVFVFGYGGTVSAHPEAPDWLRELRNGANTKCCGEDDCVPVESIEVLELDETTMQILINGTIPAQIPRTILVSIPCDKQPRVCLQKSVQQNGRVIACWWINSDGSLGILPLHQCFRCVLAQKCSASLS